MGNLEKTSSTFAEESFRQDLRDTVSALKGVTSSLNQGDGYIPKLLNDADEAAQMSRVIGNLERSTRQLETALAGLDKAIAQINTGPGLLHEVIYGESSSQAVAQFGQAAEEVALTLRGIREGNGLARSLIYGDEGSAALMSDMTAMSQDLRQVVADLRAGKGTLGALLVDPSVYEDVKLLLGNVQRNETLRALVRYSIKQDEKQSPVEVTDPSGGPRDAQANQR